MERHVYCGLLFQWVSTIKIQLSVLVQNIISLKINLFLSWSSWKIALNNNHSLTIIQFQPKRSHRSEQVWNSPFQGRPLFLILSEKQTLYQPIKATFQWNICFKNIVISDLPLKHNQWFKYWKIINVWHFIF